LESYEKFQQNPKITIHKTLKGRNAFQLAKYMLNWHGENIFDDEWATKWSDEEKNNSVFVIFTKRIIVNDKIGIRLFIGKDDNFSTIGELHPEKKAYRIWQDVIQK